MTIEFAIVVWQKRHSPVIAGLDPAIHAGDRVLFHPWILGSSPRMTVEFVVVAWQKRHSPVIAGLDPAIHAGDRVLYSSLDPRVTPGCDNRICGCRVSQKTFPCHGRT